ncbi:MAG: type IV toxin-antitoxin system AbiEi family antitoxin domain-containing protein [Solirubrobacterales bacterium]|nr:type IV toxin-antitoxin system AbiEi family antitoxin domain-containing protein [Solirubrobacterales bacterium]
MSDGYHERLYQLAESQAGYFTAQQAIGSGMDRSTLRHHARRGGRYERIRRGLFRLRHFPSSPHEHVMAAWLPLRDAGAVVSHESALELLELSDVIPNTVHMTLPRSERGQRRRDGIQLHFPNNDPAKEEIRQVQGLPVTNPERTIVDAIKGGTQPEQVEMAIHQALERGMTTPRRLRAAASSSSERAGRFVEASIEGASR